MNFLILSKQHTLLPFARRLTIDRHEAETLIWQSGKNAKYERAYQGVIDMVAHKGDPKDWQIKLQTLKEIAKDGQAIVLANHDRACADFRDAAVLYGRVKGKELPAGHLRVGGWFTGEGWEAPHLLFVDEGIQTGGQGHPDAGGMTLMRPGPETSEWILEMLDQDRDELKSRGFKGLVQYGLDLVLNSIKLKGREAGWPQLHSHAFISELDDFGGVLGGEIPVLPKRFVVALHVSQAPWPFKSNEPPEPQLVLVDPELESQVFFHDIQADQETRSLKTAGLDGHVAVVRGAADSFELAQSLAMVATRSIQFSGIQYRLDVGNQVRQTMGVLEQQFGIISDS